MSVSKLISLASNGSISSHSFFKRLIRLDLETLIWGSGYLTYSEILRQETKFGEQPTNYTFTCSPLLNQAFFLCAFSLSFLNILSLKLFSFLSLSLSISLPPPMEWSVFGRQCTSHQTLATGNGADGWSERERQRKLRQGHSHLVLLWPPGMLWVYVCVVMPLASQLLHNSSGRHVIREALTVFCGWVQVSFFTFDYDSVRKFNCVLACKIQPVSWHMAYKFGQV